MDPRKPTDRQIGAVEALRHGPERHGYVVTEFTYEQLGRYAHVVRRYQRPEHRHVYYFDIFRVGPRGGVLRRHLIIGS